MMEEMSPANTASMPFASSPWRITSSVLVERLKGSSGKPATSTAWGGRWRAPSPSPWPYGCLHLRKVASQTIARILAACITPPLGYDLRLPARATAEPGNYSLQACVAHPVHPRHPRRPEPLHQALATHPRPRHGGRNQMPRRRPPLDRTQLRRRAPGRR